MKLPEIFHRNFGTIIMKNKDLMFYAFLALLLGVLVLPAAAAQHSSADYFPGYALLLEWIKAGEQFALSKG